MFINSQSALFFEVSQKIFIQYIYRFAQQHQAYILVNSIYKFVDDKLPSWQIRNYASGIYLKFSKKSFLIVKRHWLILAVKLYCVVKLDCVMSSPTHATL